MGRAKKDCMHEKHAKKSTLPKEPKPRRRAILEETLEHLRHRGHH